MAVSDYSDDNPYGEADGSALKVHGTDEASFESNPNHATSNVEFSDDGVTHSVIGLSDGNLTADELDEVTDEKIRAMQEEIAAQKLKSLKIHISASQRQGRSQSNAKATTNLKKGTKCQHPPARSRSSSPPSPLSPAPKKSRGRPKKIPTPPITPPPPLTSCPLFIKVKADPVITKGRNGAIKYQEQPPHILGRCTLSFVMSWEEFLPFLATWVYATSVACLVVDTMLWRFSASPTAKSDSLPLVNEEGFKYMILHVQASSLRASRSLFIKMARPTKGEEQRPVGILSF
ncbi:hypothetical protein BDN67DRAFT_1015885 [Paxillus ammoniavirescens]|nr:hypothetical protein BDN67DRAFT_1015885 [Paxillus ammoniavirescens]